MLIFWETFFVPLLNHTTAYFSGSKKGTLHISSSDQISWFPVKRHPLFQEPWWGLEVVIVSKRRHSIANADWSCLRCLPSNFVADLPHLLKKAIDYSPSRPCQYLQDVCQTNKPNLTYVQGLPADKPDAALFCKRAESQTSALECSSSPFAKTLFMVASLQTWHFLDVLAFLELGSGD